MRKKIQKFKHRTRYSFREVGTETVARVSTPTELKIKVGDIVDFNWVLKTIGWLDG